MSFQRALACIVMFTSGALCGSQSASLESILEINFPNHSFVTELSLVNNDLSGTIPTTIGLYTNLNRLELDSNKLTGTIPTQIGLLSRLDHLHLEENNLRGTIPTEIFTLTRLTELWANQQNLNGSVPTSLGRLSLLESLNFRSNALTGSLPSQLGLLLDLNAIRLYENSLTGSLPTQIGRLVKLNRIDMRFNDFTGSFPSNIGKLTNVNYLALAGRNSALPNRRMNGMLPSQLGVLTKLTYLQMYRQRFSGSLPTQLGNLRLLTRMEFYDNSIEGAIPNQIGRIERLRYLRLDQNNITSTIPDSLGSLSNLERIEFDENELTGTIPSVLGELSELVTLELGVNGLTGTIPIELGRLSMLEVLTLNNNILNGIIPRELGMLTRLEKLHLQMNPNIIGTVPLEIELLASLLKLEDWSFPQGVCVNNPLPYGEAVEQCTGKISTLDTSDALFFIFVACFGAIVILFAIAVAALVVKNKKRGNRFRLWKITFQTFIAVALNLFDLVSDLLFAGSLLRAANSVSISFGKLSLLFIFIPMLVNLCLISSFQTKKLRKCVEYRAYVSEHQFSTAMYTLFSGFSTEILAVSGAGIWGLNLPITNEDKIKLRAYGIVQTFLEDIPQIAIVISHAKAIGGQWSNIAIITLATSFFSALFTIIFRTQAYCLLYTDDNKKLNESCDRNDIHVRDNSGTPPSENDTYLSTFAVKQERANVPIHPSLLNDQIESLIDMILAKDPKEDNLTGTSNGIDKTTEKNRDIALA
mmetsp:Transcript_14006/g.18164  ORF Transcript_14006/g.18164 Transcript_14006/m.18164 type:complete len:756 (-) Transcript_14006:469-2736(-)